MSFPIHRRSFLQSAVALGASGVGLMAAGQTVSEAPRRRKFTIDLTPGSIGVQAGYPELIGLAHKHGFESVAPSPQYLARLSHDELQALLADMRQKNLVWGTAGLPVEFRRDDAAFRQSMKELPGLAAALERAGASRVGTWISPGHRTLTYMANFNQHAARLREVATVLADHGQRLGLEYVGPKTSWTATRYPFIHTQEEARELIAEINVPGVGLLLDSWHWYTAGQTVDDLLSLTNADVVSCDLNDAPAGIPVDEQVDSRRELPAATGVIDLKAFLGALVQIGYDGPIRAEPFNQALAAMDDEAALAATAAAMKKAFALVE